MQKQKPASNHPPKLEKLILGAQKDIGRWSRRTKTTPIGSNMARLLTKTWNRLSPIIRRFLLISLKSRPLTPKSVKEKGKEEVIEPLGSMLPR